MSGLKQNILLNGINTLSGIIYPFITFPYAARILLPEGIGTINFLNSIISYIVLLTSLGIPIYAVREIAKVRNDKEERDKVTIEIILLSFLLSIIGYIIVLLLTFFVPQIHAQASIFFVLSLAIIFNAIGINWFYQGIEDFKFITVRAIIIRTVSILFLFIFVKSSSDLLIYAFIVVGATVGNNILNLIHLHKYISPSKSLFKNLKIFRHAKPALFMFIVNLIISLYVQLNSVMLGFMAGETAVGYYTAGTKISHICLQLITSIGVVLLPRCSNLVERRDLESFSNVISKSLDLSSCLSLPMTFGLIILASPVIYVFCGEAFMGSVPILIISAPVIWVASMTNVMGIQVLYPLDKVKIVMWSVAVGAILNIIFNVILIPSLQSSGAAISALLAEFAVFGVQIVCGKKYFPFSIRNIVNFKYIISAILMAIIVYAVTNCCETQISILISGVLVGSISYFAFLLLLKDKFLYGLIREYKLR